MLNKTKIQACFVILSLIMCVKADDKTKKFDNIKYQPAYFVVDAIIKGRVESHNTISSNWAKGGSYDKAWAETEKYFPKYFELKPDEGKGYAAHYDHGTGVAIYKIESFMTLKKNNETYGAYSLLPLQKVEWEKENRKKMPDRVWQKGFTKACQSIVRKVKQVMKEEQRRTETEKRKTGKEINYEDTKWKLGQLTEYFKDANSLKKLKKYIESESVAKLPNEKGERLKHQDEDLFDRLLKSLEQEGYHLLAGELLHEGMHSLIHKQGIGNLKSNFESGAVPFDYDEAQAYFCEINHHCKFYKWATNNIDHNRDEIDKLIDILDSYKQKPDKKDKKTLEEIEAIKAKIKALMAIIRIRMKELKITRDRINGLFDNLNEKYYKEKASNPDDLKNRESLEGLLSQFRTDLVDFNNKLSNILPTSDETGNLKKGELEEHLQALDQYLKDFNKWVKCHPERPKKEIWEKIYKRWKEWTWPDPPDDLSEKIREKAKEDLPKATDVIDMYQGSRFTPFRISLGAAVSFPAVSELNHYFSYLNDTWQGDIPEMKNAAGFWAEASYFFNDHIGFGLGYEHFSDKVAGKTANGASDYKSKNSANGVSGFLVFRSSELADRLYVCCQLGGGYYSGTYTETEDDFTVKGDDATLGLKIVADINYQVGSHFGLVAQAGYRRVVMDDFDVNFFMPDDPPVELDLSGFFAGIGVSYCR